MQAYKSAIKKNFDGRIRDRIKAVLTCDDDYTYSEIVRLLLLDDETIRRDIKICFSKNILKREKGGSQSYLTAPESEKLKSHLQ